MDSHTPPKVYLFDDDPLVLGSLNSILISNGFSCVPCQDGDAISLNADIARHSTFIIDLAMTRTNGFELISRIQRFDPGAVYIVHSATASVSDAAHLMRANALTILEKPCDPDQIIRFTEIATDRVIERVSHLHKLRQIESALALLSKREGSIAFASAVGVDNHSIADIAGCSVRTVEGHRMTINQKLTRDGAKNLYKMLANYLLNAERLKLPPTQGLDLDEINKALSRVTPKSVF